MFAKREDEIALFDELYKSCLERGSLLYAGRLLGRAAKNQGHRTALVYQDTVISYEQLYKRSLRLSKRLIEEYRLQPRQKGIICIENSPEFYVAYFALWQIGVVVVPVNTFLKENELAHIVKDSSASIIITSPEKHEVFKATGLELPPVITDCEAHADVRETLKEEDFLVDLEPEELAALLYTSGTTGVPKGVMLSSKNIMTNVLQIATLLGVEHKEKILGVLPLFHSFAQNACVWASVFYGVTIILIPKIERKYILDGLRHQPTIFLGVPALYGLLCLMKNAPLDSIRLFVSGGDALADKIRAAFSLLYRRKIVNGYGLTETSPVLSVDLGEETRPTNCIGKPLVYITFAIRDERQKDLGKNEIGVIWVKGDNVMMGYYNAPELTNKVIINGWLNTGDLGYMTPDGAIVITGREKDLIIHKGFNIYPQEIENVLLSHANVLRAAVIGKHDGDGEIPIAFVQLRKEQDGIERELRSLCLKHLASYKVPKQFKCGIQDLPMTATAKIDKKVLRKMVAEEI